MKVKVIGIDCAAQQKNVGIAFGLFVNGQVELVEAKVGSKDTPVVGIINQWIKKDDIVLLAMDAPLGWPKELSESLVKHYAGEPLVPEANNLFRRETDKFIKREIGKRNR